MSAENETQTKGMTFQDLLRLTRAGWVISISRNRTGNLAVEAWMKGLPDQVNGLLYFQGTEEELYEFLSKR